MTRRPDDYDTLASPSDGSLVRTTVASLVAVAFALAACFAAVSVYQSSRPENYVVDFYPQTSQRTARVVFRWPARGMQLPPVPLDTDRLPSTVRDKWTGSQPKRATLSPTTMLPAGRVVEADLSVPPGRYTVVIGSTVVEVSPDSEWTQGRPASEPPQ